jgi:hypothetical protein
MGLLALDEHLGASDSEELGHWLLVVRRHVQGELEHGAKGPGPQGGISSRTNAASKHRVYRVYVVKVEPGPSLTCDGGGRVCAEDGVQKDHVWLGRLNGETF